MNDNWHATEWMMAVVYHNRPDPVVNRLLEGLKHQRQWRVRCSEVK